jgi:hypothetical protein
MVMLMFVDIASQSSQTMNLFKAYMPKTAISSIHKYFTKKTNTEK